MDLGKDWNKRKGKPTKKHAGTGEALPMLGQKGKKRTGGDRQATTRNGAFCWKPLEESKSETPWQS